MPLLQRLRRLSSSQAILVAMAAGVAIGFAFPESGRLPGGGGFAATDLQLFATIFLRLVKLLIVPLIFGTVVVGIASQSDLKRTGRLALRAFVLFTVLTGLALLIGWVAAAIVQPGQHVPLDRPAELGTQLAGKKPGIAGVIEAAIPQSIVDAAARNDVLQVLVFSILFAVAVAQAPDRARRTMVEFAEGLTEVMFRFTAIVMLYAPIGIGAALAVTVGKGGLGVLRGLGVLVVTCLAALAVFIVGVLLPLALLARVPLRSFWKAMREPVLVAFSAASSDAALPVALRRLDDVGVPKRVAGFVMPAALSFNLTGSTLFVGLATLFVAQAAGVHFSVAEQATIMGTLLITTKGIASVPRASLVILSATLAALHLPLEGVAVILAVDAIMDMARTGTNMLSHTLATVVLAKWEGPEPT